MLKQLPALFLLLFFVPLTMFGEGSKQLTPNQSGSALTSADNDKAGYLAHDANFPSATGVSITSLSFLKPSTFSRNGATYSKDHRLYVRVKNGDRLFYGVHRAVHDQTTANQGDLTITIRRTLVSTGVDDASFSVVTTLNRDQNSTRDMLLVANQNGVIDNATEATNGPNRVSIGGKAAVTNGYTPLSIINSTGSDYDYYVEFTQAGEANMADGQRFSVYDFWDFTVIDASGNEKQGRLRSKLWSFSSGGTTNLFSKNFNMYPLVPSNTQTGKYFVKKIELAGIAPQNFFRFVTNSFGSDATVGSTFETRRKSQTSQKDYPEFSNFVNNPDETEWPSASAPTFNVTSIANSCNTATSGGKTTFTINSSEQSTFIALLDLNGTSGYQSGTSDVLIEQSGAAGTRTIDWNGLDGLGQPVAKNTSITYRFRNGSSPINFPMWDAEVNNGFRAEDVRPVAGSNYNALLFWDDTNLSTTTFPAPQSQLFGLAPIVSNTTGLHNWGSTTTTATTYNAGDLKTVNTWTYGYTNELTQTATFTYDCSADVAVTNTVSSGTYTIGKELTYTVVVTNNGPIAASNVSVADLLDNTKLQFVSASDAAYVSSSGVWTVGALAVGASRTLTITAKPLVTGSISTTATQTHTETDNVAANNSATNTITVVAAADIAVTNTVPQTTYYNGDQVTYTLTAKNNGPNAATGVVINDLLPASAFANNTITYSAPAGTTYNTATGAWTIGNLAINETKTITITGTVSQLGSVTNTASLGDRTGLQVDETSGNNTASNTITVSPSADLSVTSSVSNATPNQNEVIAYTINVINNGPNNATSVSVANLLPAGLTFVSAETTAGSYNSSTGAWTVGSVLASGWQTLTIYAKPTVTGSLSVTSTQTHTEFDRVSGNNSASTAITVSPTADVAVTNTVSAPANGTTYTNEPVTYTVTVTNNGPSPATTVSITDLLPSSLTYTGSSSSAGTGTYNSTTGVWSVGTLANGASAVLTINATINNSAVITTTATQTHTEYDNINGNNSASNSIQSGSGTITADINVTTSANAATYYTGDQVTYTVRATNQGPDAATNITLSAPLPTGFTYVSSNPKVGTYDQGTGIWTIPGLANGSFTELTLIGKPVTDTNVTGDKAYAFTAARTGTPNQVDNDATDNSSTTNITVKKAADVATSISVSSNSADGFYYHNVTTATFQITVTNNGPDRVTNLVGQDTRTGTITFTGVSAPTGTTYDPATGYWTVGTLEPGESKTLTVTGIPNTTGRLNLGGQVYSADQFDKVTENNKALALLNVLPVADVVVTNTAPATFNNGENTTFTVTVQNNGPDAATNLKIQDALPTGLTLVSALPSSGTYSSGIWTLGTDLLSGAANAQTLVLTVTPQAATTYSTTASVLSVTEYDNVSSNNSQTASITGTAAADVVVTSALSAGPYYVGGTYTITVNATNDGPDAATGVKLTDSLPVGLKLVSSSAPAGTSYDATTNTWTVGSIAKNEIKSLILTVQPESNGTLTYSAYKSAGDQYDKNGGNTISFNNSTVASITVTDKEATAQVLLNNKHYFFFNTGQDIATLTDADGPIQNATFISGTKNGVAITALPNGVRLTSNGELEVDYKFSLQAGTYALIIETVDQHGGVSQTLVNYIISNDWDSDGVNDDIDLDDNNDGVITEAGAVNPTGDDDNDGIYNFLDRTFVHPTFGVFIDRNGDDINDAFDIDLDGLIRGFDVDIDGDGIPNVIEAYGGVVPAGDIYNPLTATIKGAVNEYGIPVAIVGATSTSSTVPALDTDGDSRRDYEDMDADNDGIIDNVEAQTTNGFITRVNSDADVDGLDDAYDVTCGCTTSGIALSPVNYDGIDNLDYLDRDSDNDGSADYIEAFDDDQDGQVLNDMKGRAAIFEAAMGLNYYTTSDADNDGIPNWLESVNGVPAYLTFGNEYYHDTDKNGLVDLFDSQSGGRAATLQTSGADSQYDFRSIGEPVTLPVTLLNFAGKYQDNQVLLNWATATELNNSYFIIERSANGKIFNEIGKVTGAGTSNQLKNYSLLDKKYNSGINYYRLKQVDLDGSIAYSKIVAVDVSNQKNNVAQISLYPNPATNSFQLNLTELPQENITIEIININGKTVSQKQILGGLEQQVDISNLAAGNYIVRIWNSTYTNTLRLIKK